MTYFIKSFAPDSRQDGIYLDQNMVCLDQIIICLENIFFLTFQNVLDGGIKVNIVHLVKQAPLLVDLVLPGNQDLDVLAHLLGNLGDASVGGHAALVRLDRLAHLLGLGHAVSLHKVNLAKHDVDIVVGDTDGLAVHGGLGEGNSLADGFAFLPGYLLAIILIT